MADLTLPSFKKLIVSGIIDMRAKDVENSAAEHGFIIEEKLMREEWCAYILRKN
jgi:ribosomal protein L11 methylase PrmA